MQTLHRNPVSADRAYAVIDEQEPTGSGTLASVTTLFLTASECPVGCAMCDLWQNTLSTPTPPGAIPRQIDAALLGRNTIGKSGGDWIKLYNSGNFFDPRSIPPEDYETIAKQCERFDRVVVENHPRFGAKRLLRFRDLISGQLEVAVGLETVQPRWLKRLAKQMTRDRFDQYATWLAKQDVDLRVFLIVGVPGISVDEAMRWTRLSVRHAARCGARHISLIPARSGHGWNGRADELPTISLERLDKLQVDAIRDAGVDSVVTVDVWDADALECDQHALESIQHRNLDQGFMT